MFVWVYERVSKLCVEACVCVCMGMRAKRQQTYPETKSDSDKTQTRLGARDLVPLLTKPGDNSSSAAQSWREEKEKWKKKVKAIIFL